MDQVQAFGNVAKGLARNPLGIIALFIVLIYGFASLVVGFSGHLTENERIPIVWFLVIFPAIVLAVFAWLVSKHHTKLYAPSDYKGDEAFIAASQASIEAAVSLGAAGVKWAEKEGASSEDMTDFKKNVAEQVASVFGHSRKRWQRKEVLWVDDRPDNNILEREALTSFGIKFSLALSTDEAVEEVSRSSFDAIISDMGRPPDKRAGYTLLEKLRAVGDKTPFFIYAGSRAKEHVAEAKKRGAQGTTNRPDELFGMILATLGLDN